LGETITRLSATPANCRDRSRRAVEQEKAANQFSMNPTVLSVAAGFVTLSICGFTSAFAEKLEACLSGCVPKAGRPELRLDKA
jgi:hypothetical protein